MSYVAQRGHSVIKTEIEVSHSQANAQAGQAWEHGDSTSEMNVTQAESTLRHMHINACERIHIRAYVIYLKSKRRKKRERPFHPSVQSLSSHKGQG